MPPKYFHGTYDETLDIFTFGLTLNELVLIKHPSYMSRSTEEKDKIFLSFYEKFHPRTMIIIEREFSPKLLGQLLQRATVKIKRNVDQEKIIQYPIY